ncbi:endonuclease/exonuclease/phosphatase family protein [Nocardioides sp. BGMRC 2183]|nr:endonuclease/exonuclease/phosphatase family protein [Nocardioides sp. BGMRC 2183]
MRRTRPIPRLITVLVTTTALALTAAPPGAASPDPGERHGHHGHGGKHGHGDRDVRFSTFNASLNRGAAGQLAVDLATPDNEQAANVAETIQRVRPDVLLVNEFDYDPAAVDLFRENYLEVGHHGARPIRYPYAYVAPSNTGVPSGHDLDNNGEVGGGNDAFGFGLFEGQYGMVVYSRYPIDTRAVRTFQTFRWADMPGALLPDDPTTEAPADWYSAAELEDVRLSSKSHWDVPIRIGRKTVHFLVSHPTPPTFDGPEDRNGLRNHDEIRFWADYVSGGRTASYIYDDRGRYGGLRPGSRFVIAGDQNADPMDGDSVDAAIDQLLDHHRINDPAPRSAGGVEAVDQGGANDAHRGDPALDTADFADTAPGNLRVDYVLPSRGTRITGSGIFWPTDNHPLYYLTGDYDPARWPETGVPTSDHRQVWVDVRY